MFAFLFVALLIAACFAVAGLLEPFFSDDFYDDDAEEQPWVD